MIDHQQRATNEGCHALLGVQSDVRQRISCPDPIAPHESLPSCGSQFVLVSREPPLLEPALQFLWRDQKLQDDQPGPGPFPEANDRAAPAGRIQQDMRPRDIQHHRVSDLKIDFSEIQQRLEDFRLDVARVTGAAGPRRKGFVNAVFVEPDGARLSAEFSGQRGFADAGRTADEDERGFHGV